MTIKEIAEAAHVSIGTVDRVLHHRGGVNKETEETIKRIAKEKGYTTNQFARNLKLGKTYHFAVLLPLFHSESNYWELVHEGIEKAGQGLSPLSVVIDYYPFDRSEKNSFAKQFALVVEKKPDALVLAPPGKEEMEVVCAASSLPPVCLIDSGFPGFCPISTIAQDPYRGGVLAGKIITLMNLKRPGTYLCFQVHSDAYNSSERARGFHDYLAKENSVIDVSCPPEDSLEDVLDQVFGKTQHVIGMFTTNSVTSRVGDYLVNHGLKQQVVLLGYDLVQDNRTGLEKGSIDCIISQRPTYQGYTAINQLYQYVVLGQKQEPTVEIPIDIVVKENLMKADD